MTATTPRAAFKAITNCWINVYAGPPDFLLHDKGTEFSSEEFREYAKNDGIVVKEVPTEAHNQVGVVERQHHIIRTVFHKLHEDEPATPERRFTATRIPCS